ncbi:hypothetical protein ACIB24_05760 [Spongisporangium articulatum]|uniref:ParB-like nuclease domain-containing protein n=1 Tax=Spongisporangium articulatum TaxID=3362603 RepID=A0ABW8AJN3_9ACTN
MRTQFHFWPTAEGKGYDAWDVARLIELSLNLPVHDVPVDALTEVDTNYWSEPDPTVRWVVGHARLIRDVDTGYPIILRPDGCVMDGMHRVCRALLEDRPTIAARRFTVLPEPDHRNVALTDLP